MSTLMHARQAYDLASFEDAVCRHGLRVTGIHYYHGIPTTWHLKRSGAIVDFNFLAIVQPAAPTVGETCEEEDTETGPLVIGLVELQVNPYNEREVWLKYLSVREGYRQQGVSGLLIEMVCQAMQERYSGRVLSRSSPSEAGELYVKDAMTKKLTAAGIQWKFSSS